MFVHKGVQDMPHNALVLSSIPGGRLLAMGDFRRTVAGSWMIRNDDDLREVIRDVYPHLMPLRKRILRDVLKGLVHDLHYQRIGVPSPMTTTAIERELELNPPRRHSWEASYNPKRVSSAVTQDLPVQSDDAVDTYYIMDLSDAQLMPERGIQKYGGVNPLACISPPEVSLKGPWNEKLDIWQFGCLVYQILSQQELFYFFAYA
ncbi:hypothetical protein D9619_011897 [Psilocybe cf. subviscida]|uniref:Protein kinase domain-containing protein n=1 Tax=Psilocybe cf. subviscida TaxID=2480587 RepID=A0A8H5B138_9AGAR|nr:hypothetical protein D9619_011897 [Psilocybe cf. subviscida]